MDDRQLADALLSATMIEREVHSHLETHPGPAEEAMAWTVYRNAVAVRKALIGWAETRKWRAGHPDADKAVS